MIATLVFNSSDCSDSVTLPKLDVMALKKISHFRIEK